MTTRRHSSSGLAGRGRTASSVLVPLDGHEGSLAALPVAKALAELEGATLHVVHVAERRLPPRELIRLLGVEAGELFGTVVDELEAATPAEAIVALADRSPGSRIVIAARSEEAAGRELGEVAEGVLSLARCPVLLVRPERGLAPWGLRRLLVPHDGAPATARALGPAVGLADLARAAMTVLHVASLGADEPAAGTLPLPAYVDQPQHEWPEWSRQFLEQLEVCCELPERLHPRFFLSRGEPGAQILRWAVERRADLVVLAWRGRLLPDRARTAKEVLLKAPCPVLFLRVEPEEADWQRASAERSGVSAHF